MKTEKQIRKLMREMLVLSDLEGEQANRLYWQLRALHWVLDDKGEFKL